MSEIKEFAPVQEELVVSEAGPKFDPTKRYTWNNDQQFAISGAEFGVILNALRAVMSTPEARALFMAAEAADHIEGILVRNVENGAIKETPETPEPKKGSL